MMASKDTYSGSIEVFDEKDILYTDTDPDPTASAFLDICSIVVVEISFWLMLFCRA